jgi:DNA-binding transcriptional regulator YhcF (GntR family)
MDIELPTDDQRPAFLQLADAVRGAIARDNAPPGTPLPAVRSLALRVGLHANTVLHAYRELARQGIVESRRGQGTFVAQLPPAAAERRVLADELAERALREARARGITVEEFAAALARANRRAPR